ncbi:MAG: helix-turn-helix domain-containing protein [Candidatus Woesearchaeota archaeon]
MNIEVIEDLGFSQREAQAYLALLELGPSTITPITEHTGIPSSKIYEVLRRLADKGMVSYIVKGRAKHFQAAAPENLLNTFNDRKTRFESILEELKKKQEFTNKQSKVEYVEGKKAIFSILNKLLNEAKPGEEYFAFSVGHEHKDQQVSTFMANYALKRQAKKFQMKVLSYEEYRTEIENAYPARILRMINNRFTKFRFPQGVIILGDVLVLHSWEEPATATIIHSRKTAQEYKEFFNQIYTSATP